MPIVLAVFFPGIASSQASDSQTRPVSVRAIYEQHDKAASAARKAGDWAAVRRHAAAVDTLFNGNPAALISTARAHARLGEHTAALNLVRTVLSMGIVRNVAEDPDLAALRSSPEWIELLSLNESNRRAIGSPRSVFSIPDPTFLAEDIAWDGARDRYLVSSVRKGIVAAAGRDGKLSPFITRHAGLWGAFAVAIDSARSKLWVTTVAMPHFEGYVAADSGRAAAVRFDLATGALEKRYEMRRTSRGNSPGDAAVAPNGDLYVSDSRSGVLYVIRSGVDSLEVLVPEGTFMSLQGPAVARDGRSLYVADYIRGIARVEASSGAVKWLTHPRTVAVSGIDGLALAGEKLIAVQNGLAPHRVIELTLDAAGDGVAAARVLAQDTAAIREPTHGVVRGGEFHFIANSGWDSFDDAGATRKAIQIVVPRVMRVSIDF